MISKTIGYNGVHYFQTDLGCFLFGQTFAFMVGFPKFAIAEKKELLEGIDDWRRNYCMPIIDDFATKECFFTYAASICKLVTHTTHKYIYIYICIQIPVIGW